MVDRFERFSFMIFEITRCWHKLASEEMTKYGLKGPYAIYFTVLQNYPEGLTSSRLAELCGRDKADVSRAVSHLEEKGLITRQQGNPYRAKLMLTDSGMIAAQLVSRRAAQVVELAGKDISDADRDNFYQVLTSITENLHTLCQDGLPEEL